MMISNGLLPILIRLLADWLVLAIVLGAAYALLRHVPKAGRYQTYGRLFMFGLTAYAFAKILGMLYQPAAERPFVTLGVAPGAAYLNNPGFPSDHALFVFTLTLAVWLGTRDKLWTVILLALSLLVSAGRVLALVHTPLDVLGSAVVVAVAGLLWYRRRRPENPMFAKH